MAEKKTYKFDFEIKPDLCMDCATCWYVCVNDGGSGSWVKCWNAYSRGVLNS